MFSHFLRLWSLLQVYEIALVVSFTLNNILVVFMFVSDFAMLLFHGVFSGEWRGGRLGVFIARGL